jgi:hypothetical protein
MDSPPPVANGFLRISVRLPAGESYTPGDLARVVAVGLDQLGSIFIERSVALVDVRYAHARQARMHLERLGPTRLLDWQWRWLRLAVGRNHGLSMGQFKKIMQAADALPLGRIHIQNTHSLVGVQDFKIESVVERLSAARVNGFAIKPEVLPPGKGPGSPAFTAGAVRGPRPEARS